MDQSHIYIIFFLFILIQIIFVFNFDKLASFLNLYDAPDKIRKKHLGKTPLLGGVIIFSSILFNYFLTLLDTSFISDSKFFFINQNSYVYFMLACFLMFCIGLIDDKYNISYLIKIISTAIVIFTIIYFDKDVSINSIQFSFYSERIDTSKVSMIFTTLCFLLFINAINMFDGIDGQVGLYSLLILSFILTLIGLNYFIIFFLLSFFTFLYLNLNKKCFLGDSGTILIGFIFSYILIKLYNNGFIHFADKIFLIMIIPGLDMLRLFAERLIKKKNPFKGDDNHIHHLLQNKIGKNKSILFIQVLIIAPVVLSIYFNLLMLNFLTTIIYFLIIIILKSSKVN
mgnify:CR=1 FL=1